MRFGQGNHRRQDSTEAAEPARQGQGGLTSNHRMAANPPPNQQRPTSSRPPAPQNPMRSIRLWVTLGIILLANIIITNVLLAPAQPTTVTLPYDVFKQQVTAGNVISVTTTGDAITGVTKTPVNETKTGVTATHFTTQRPSFADDGLEPLLEQHG